MWEETVRVGGRKWGGREREEGVACTHHFLVLHGPGAVGWHSPGTSQVPKCALTRNTTSKDAHTLFLDTHTHTQDKHAHTLVCSLLMLYLVVPARWRWRKLYLVTWSHGGRMVRSWRVDWTWGWAEGGRSTWGQGRGGGVEGRGRWCGMLRQNVPTGHAFDCYLWHEFSLFKTTNLCFLKRKCMYWKWSCY